MHTFNASQIWEAKWTIRPKLETAETPVAAAVAVPVAIRDVASTGSHENFSRPTENDTSCTTTGFRPLSISAQFRYCGQYVEVQSAGPGTWYDIRGLLAGLMVMCDLHAPADFGDTRLSDIK